MEAPEIPTEHLQEEMTHHAHASKASWVMGVALSSAILAALAAVTALLAGHHANEAMIDQLRASDQWNYYQAKGVKANVLGSKSELLQALGKPPDEKDARKLSEYKREQEAIKVKADGLEKVSSERLKTHNMLAKGVTFFQVAIAVAAISVLTHKRRFWFVSLGFGAIGTLFFAQGLFYDLQKRASWHHIEEAEAEAVPEKAHESAHEKPTEKIAH